MIETHRIPASQNAPTEWRAPYGPGSVWRVLVAHIEAGNNSAAPGRVLMTVNVDGTDLWTVATGLIPASDIGITWFVFDGATERAWTEGTEMRELVSVPRLEPDAWQKVTLRFWTLAGTNMNLSGRVVVDRLNDPHTN